tara:strand:- start:326 stop:463 length:138 start_codon:yes stop_codon:yes gene_type:complete
MLVARGPTLPKKIKKIKNHAPLLAGRGVLVIQYRYAIFYDAHNVR